MLFNLNIYEGLYEYNIKAIYQNNYILKWIILIIIFVYLFYYFTHIKYIHQSLIQNVSTQLNIPLYKSKLIEENFFIIDSDNLENISSHMYGYSISKDGFLTDNYYKKIGHYEEPESIGSFIMIRTNGKEIIINQDFYGNFGIYLYEDKSNKYFALSNSFLLLEEFLVEKKKISLNKDFSDNFITVWLCTPSIYETMIEEITRLPSNGYIIINIKNKSFEIKYIDYQQNTIPLESEKGLKIIDEWVDKWAYIIRSLKKVTENIYFDLSGGFDSRVVLAIFLSSGVDPKDMSFNSFQSNAHGHDEDLKIAKNISLKLGFQLNNLKFDNNYTKWSPRDTLFCSMYTKLGLHKEFYFQKGFFNKPRIAFTGAGGEFIRGSPGAPIKELLEILSNGGRDIIDYKDEFYYSSMRLCNRSINQLKQQKTYENDYEISTDFYSKFHPHHFGKKTLEGFLANYYFLQPLIDPDLNKIKYNISKESSFDLIAYIYVRFAHKLIYFPFQGNRTLNQESVYKAEKLNNNLKPYIIKSDYNKNFYLDNEKISPVLQSNNSKPAEEYLKELFASKNFINIINRIYKINVYNWAKKYSENSNFFPLRHEYGLLAIAITLEQLSLNKRYMRKKLNRKNFYNENYIMKFISNIK